MTIKFKLVIDVQNYQSQFCKWLPKDEWNVREWEEECVGIGNETETGTGTEIEVGIVRCKYHSKYALQFIIVINALCTNVCVCVSVCISLSVDVNAID